MDPFFSELVLIHIIDLESWWLFWRSWLDQTVLWLFFIT